MSPTSKEDAFVLAIVAISEFRNALHYDPREAFPQEAKSALERAMIYLAEDMRIPMSNAFGNEYLVAGYPFSEDQFSKRVFLLDNADAF